MDNTCAVCHGHAPAEHYLCDACQYRMRSWLREITRQHPLLRAVLRPDTGPAQRGGSGRAHSPLPVDVRVLDILGPGHVVPWIDAHGDQTGGVPLEPLLYGWARYITKEIDAPSVRRDEHGTVRIQPCTDPWPHGGSSVPGWCAWLQAYLPYVARQSWAPTMYDQLEDVVNRIQQLTHTRPRSRLMNAPCPGCSAITLRELEGQFHISCTGCSVRLTREEYDAHRASVMPVLVRTALLMQAQQERARRAAAA
ncbi:hypothetical protein [Streptomyces sp. NPDC001876]|uniref:hypothetical protein n=1 Tax=Streptomyces sp. NPDC001876 TaxID=3154402 RepID=UPI0033325907